MSSKKQFPGVLEADGCVHIQFSIVRGHGTVTQHEADCGLGTTISGLKDDLFHVFGVPTSDQIWKYDGSLLEDEKTLKFYEFDRKKDKILKIIVNTLKK